MRFGDKGVGFRHRALGLRDEGLGSRHKGLRSRGKGSESRDKGLGFGGEGSGLKAERIQTCLQWCLRDQVGWYGYYIQDIRVNFLAIHIHIYIYISVQSCAGRCMHMMKMFWHAYITQQRCIHVYMQHIYLYTHGIYWHRHVYRRCA